MSTVNHEAALSALYHIEAIERRLNLLKQLLDSDRGLLTDTRQASGLFIRAEDEMQDLRSDIVRLL
jgi:hypothetical protein